MSASGADAFVKAEEMSRRRLRLLIAGRAVVALLLLVAGALWPATLAGGGPETARPAGTPPVMLAALALSVVYVILLRFTRISTTLQASLQFAFDILLVTWLVWVTGRFYSPYSALYIVVISMAGLFLGARGALLAALGCAVSYTSAMMGLTLVLATGRNGAGSATTGEAVEAIGLNNVAFLVVGLLAAQLVRRQTRSEVRMIETAHALASLRELHERIVESIRSGVITTDLERRVYTINRAAEEMTGYSAEDLRGHDVGALFGDLHEQTAQSLAAAEAGQPSPRYEADCLTAEGFRVRLGYSISPLAAEEGETTGLVITFQDLTEVRSMEETSRRQERLSAVGRVAAGIAHEIRNPLAAMRGSIQVLRSELSADSSQAELMEIVLRESDRLNRIITDFLTYARPRRVSLAETDLREPLEETFALLRHSPEISDGHTLETELPDEPLIAMADAEGIKQVFWNLARNALKAMPDGGRLRAEMQRAGTGTIRITFTDTGRGMSPAQVERLFEPFSSSTTGGTGLGLSIVYQIVRDHGGVINVRSREGHGTTITIELPSAAGATALR